MKKSILFVIFLLIAINLRSQSSYDYIGRDEFYLLKTGSDVKSTHKLKASELKSSKVTEQLFGIDYKEKKYTNVMSDEKFTRVSYMDGLKIEIPEYEKSGIQFHITSDKYTMLLQKGQTIKVGMKADELKDIFPKSFAKRKIITEWVGNEGKTSFIVYFSRINNNKLEMEDSWIIFILNNGLLEQILTAHPL